MFWQTCLNRKSSGILGMFNMFSGGALSRFSIFALGIMPYISASIIMQLGTVAVPHLEQLKKDGEAGRRKITQYTRYGTLVLATFQGFGISVALQAQQGLVPNPGMMFQMTSVITLVTGTLFLMWLGEQITERGLGNGISLIIFCGYCRWITKRDWQHIGIGTYGRFFDSVGIAAVFRRDCRDSSGGVC